MTNMIKHILVASVCALSLATVQAESLSDALDSKGVNYIRGGKGIIYLLDETDPREVCELADIHPGDNIKDVFNVQTLVNATCQTPK